VDFWSLCMEYSGCLCGCSIIYIPSNTVEIQKWSRLIKCPLRI